MFEEGWSILDMCVLDADEEILWVVACSLPRNLRLEGYFRVRLDASFLLVENRSLTGR